MRTSCKTYLLIVLLVALLVCPPPLLAAVIVVDGTCTLVDAITAANTDTATGGCPAGSGADEIQLTVDVTLTAVDNDTEGPNGLPSVTSEMTIRSSDDSPRTIERASGAPTFRILHIGSTGDLSLERVVVSNGDTSLNGGGIFNRSHLALTNTTVSSNSAGIGGGIQNLYGTVTLSQSTVSGNSASGGGGIFNYGSGATVSLTESTVWDNSAESFWGGGILNIDGIVALTNSTLSGNSASSTGGGIFNYGYSLSATVTLTNSTLSGNSANSSGGIHNTYFYGTATATLTGSLVANSPNGGNCGGPTPVTDGSNNLADDATCGTIPDTLTGLDPVLAHNGGPTLTHALLPGSNAIDLAGDCGLPTDQRLALRNDGNCDSGSFEFTTIFLDGFESGDTSAWSGTVP